jgi:predicted exporter
MGMGVDYGVFVLDSARDPSRLAPTLLSLVVSCLTTLFVFGTLALSQHVALRSMGATIGTGIALALLISPSVLVLSRRGSA